MSATIDRTGRRYERLTVIERVGISRQGVLWLCRCDCGNESVVRADALGKSTLSCGCLSREQARGLMRELGLRARKDVVTYSGAHQRVRMERGKASRHACVDCRGPAQHWAYDHNDPDELVEVNARTGRPMSYSVKPEHYSPRCATCHKRFDLKGAWG